MEQIISNDRADRPNWLLRILLIAAVFGAAFLAWTLYEPPRTRFTLANGSQLEFITAQPGGVPITSDTRFVALVRRFLPGKMKDWLPSEFTGSAGIPGELAVYFQLTPSPNPAANAVPSSVQFFMAEDSAGHRYGIGGGSSSYGYGKGNQNDQIQAFQLSSFPRREKEFKLLLLDANFQVLHSITVQNPFHGPFPEWKAEPLPICRTNGPVIATLESLAQWTGPNQRQATIPKLTFESSDPKWQKARNRYVTFFDATGNHGNPLSPDEPVWKLEIDVHRPNPEDFLPSDKLVLTNLAIQGPGQFLPLDATAEKNGVKIFIHGLAGPGALVFTNGTDRTMTKPTGLNGGWSSSYGSGMGTNRTESFGSRNAFFLIEATGTQDGDDIRMILRDESGTDIPFDNSHGLQTRGDTQLHIKEFVPPPGVTNVSLEIIVSRPLKFEFPFDPKEIKSATP
jgi:hypothetical protein